MIADEAAAQRLARALLSDVRLYNRSKLAAGGDARSVLAAELEEARALFRQRAAPELHSVFEREVDAFDFTLAAASPKTPLVALSLAFALAIVGYLIFLR